ncbi:MAG: sensor histidine kinase [Eubacteriales bacterium]|nr:sensor histidine kinase [Eubacteriales bacterium]
MKPNISIRTQIHLYLALTILVCVLVVLFSAASTQEAIQGTHVMFDCNSALTEFYSLVGKADFHAREWIYSEDDQELAQYQDYMAQARERLDWMQGLVDSHFSWRLGRLSNMLEYYHDPLADFRAGRAVSGYETYQALAYRCTLIRSTSTTYHDYLAQYLHQTAEEVQQRWQRTWQLQLGIMALLLVLGFLSSSFYSKSILRPLRTLVENAHLVQNGQFDLRPVGRAPRELMVMSGAFEEMAQRIRENMEILKKNAQLEQMLLRRESERLAMEHLVTQAELRSLQAQINPHFLFNTLSMISKSAYLSGDASTSEMIDRLAKFLRYALDKSNTTSTLREELASIENYLFIQKKRFSGRLDFVLDVREEVPNIKMPAIVLQPLVENAIQHGIGGMTEAAVISLKVRLREGRVRILIEDNGAGMPPERLEQLQSCLKLGLESSSGSQGSGIGLTNVYRRLKMYFGSRMQFTIESEETCGTVIAISLPGEEEP